MKTGALLSIVMLSAITGCRHRDPELPVPAGLPLLSREQWDAHAPVLPMRMHRIQRLTIHHTAVMQAPGRSTADKLRALQRFSQRADSLADGRPKPAWADVPYHLYVGVDGTVAEARPWRYVGDSNTPYDPTGHLLVVVEGNFEVEQPSTAQLHALDVLVPALVRHFDISPGAIGGHRDFASTRCPGRALYAELPRLRALAARAR